MNRAPPLAELHLQFHLTSKHFGFLLTRLWRAPNHIRSFCHTEPIILKGILRLKNKCLVFWPFRLVIFLIQVEIAKSYFRQYPVSLFFWNGPLSFHNIPIFIFSIKVQSDTSTFQQWVGSFLCPHVQKETIQWVKSILTTTLCSLLCLRTQLPSLSRMSEIQMFARQFRTIHIYKTTYEKRRRCGSGNPYLYGNLHSQEQGSQQAGRFHPHNWTA